MNEKDDDTSAWINADEWLHHLTNGGRIKPYGLRHDPKCPLGGDAATSFAKQCGYPFEHRPDGSTIIRVGRIRARRAHEGFWAGRKEKSPKKDNGPDRSEPLSRPT